MVHAHCGTAIWRCTLLETNSKDCRLTTIFQGRAVSFREGIFFKHTPQKKNLKMSPDKGPFHKESRLPTMIFQGIFISFQGSTLAETNSKSPWKWMVGILIRFLLGRQFRPIWQGVFAASFQGRVTNRWRDFQGSSWRRCPDEHLSSDLKGPSLIRLHRGWNTIQLYKVYNRPWNKDPH